MPDWEDLRHFAALAEGGTLSEAARRLGVEHATVARRIAALEHDLALKLIDRRGRRLTLTGDGVRVAAHITAMEEGALAIARVAAGARHQIAGEVRISAPPALAAAMLVAPLAALRAQHSGLVLHLLGETRNASLERREADVAIRLSRPTEGDLVARKLGELSFSPYAAARYLATTAEPDRCFIGYDGSMEEAPQQVALRQMAAGRPYALFASTLEIQLAAVRAGLGIAMLPDFLVTPSLDLVRVDCDAPAPSREAWLAIHADLRNAEPFRAVTDALEAAFR